MRRMQFQKKIEHYTNVLSFFEGAAISFFIGACLFLDSIYELTIIYFVLFLGCMGVCYYAKCRVKFYKKSLYYHNKRMYSKPITLKLAA
jgi:hypothetical protein